MEMKLYDRCFAQIKLPTSCARARRCFRAETRLEEGDVVMLAVEPASEPALRAFLEGAQASSKEQAG